MRITEQWILSHAPGPAVAKNARALSEAGRYTVLRRSPDGQTVWAVCAGSARNPYSVSVDCSLSEKDPIYSCSCSSPHFPCKHVLGLLYELVGGRHFAEGEPPPYVLRAREKRLAELARAELRLSKLRRHDAAAKDRRLELCFEGLVKAEKLTNALLADGLDTLPSLPAQSLERLATEMGNFGLTGARDSFERIAVLERRLRRRSGDEPACRAALLRELTALRVMTVRSREFLAEQRASGSYAMEDPVLFELLGGVWNPEELAELGYVRKNARLVQLSFAVVYDEARRTETSRAYWADLSQGDVVYTASERTGVPSHCEGSDDSCFDLLEVPLAYETPTAACPRVWWDSATPTQPYTEDWQALLRLALPLETAVAEARSQLCEPLLPGFAPALIEAGALGSVNGAPVLEDPSGARILLADRWEDGAELATAQRSLRLSQPVAPGDALFGVLFFNRVADRICFQPYSLVTAGGVIRLLY